jgi:hypothetical protein
VHTVSGPGQIIVRMGIIMMIMMLRTHRSWWSATASISCSHMAIFSAELILGRPPNPRNAMATYEWGGDGGGREWRWT